MSDLETIYEGMTNNNPTIFYDKIVESLKYLQQSNQELGFSFSSNTVQQGQVLIITFDKLPTQNLGDDERPDIIDVSDQVIDQVIDEVLYELQSDIKIEQFKVRQSADDMWSIQLSYDI